MIIQNVWIYKEDKIFCKGSVKVQGERITEVIWEDEENCVSNTMEMTDVSEMILDGQGAYLIPGMIDIHTHGCIGYDFCDGTREAVQEIARFQAAMGVTGFVPATMTLPVEQLEHILQTGAWFRAQKSQGAFGECADLVGINMEGPFISREKKGAQNEAYITMADGEIFRRFQQAADGLVKYMGVAPETGEITDFIRQVKKEAKVTLAHSNADYETAKKAFEEGACHVTHLYNAMPPFHHRDPGIIGAAAENRQVEVELICDGVHIHPSVIRATFSMYGADRIVLISDSMRAMGMPDGVYELGGQKVVVEGAFARLEDGTIAGSVTSLPQCLRYVVEEAGIPLEDAVACVTMNPAKSLGIYEKYGSIQEGKQADLVLLDKKLHVQAVIKAGRILVSKDSLLYNDAEF